MATESHKCQADKRGGEPHTYQPGDRIWLLTHDLKNNTDTKKLNGRFIGPYEILDQVNSVSYKLKLLIKKA